MARIGRLGVWMTIAFLAVQVVATAATIRVSGDNTWKVFHNGTLIGEGADWQRPTVSDFDLDARGAALLAIYVHDAEPGAAGSGGMLADIILDDGTYLSTNVDDPNWVCDVDEPIAARNDDWEQPNFDDASWEPLTFYDKFGGGIWGFGAGTMRQTLKDPDSEAFWCWCQANNLTDEVYFRYRIGSLSVDKTGKLATIWSALKAHR